MSTDVHYTEENHTNAISYFRYIPFLIVNEDKMRGLQFNGTERALRSSMVELHRESTFSIVSRRNGEDKMKK